MAFQQICFVSLGLLCFFNGPIAAGWNHNGDFQCPSEGFHADPSDCRVFYRCVQWNTNVLLRNSGPLGLTPFRFTCGPGTVFDPELSVCNHPRDTTRRECGGRTNEILPEDQYPFVYPSGGNENPLPSYQPHLDAYDHYPQWQRDEAENQISPVMNALESSEDCVSEGFLPVPGDCHSFMRCTSNGINGFTKFIFKCGEGTVWDQNNLVCNYPSAVPGCSETSGTLTDGGQEYPEKDEINMQGGQYPHQPEENYPDVGSPGDYSPYEEEQSGNPLPIDSPNHVSQQPEYPQGGGYSETNKLGQGQNNENGLVYPEEVSQESQLPPGDVNECHTDGFFAVQGDCKRFYRCVEDEKGGYMRYDFVCGPNTVWDQEVKTCNHPGSVNRKDCSASTTDQPSTDGLFQQTMSVQSSPPTFSPASSMPTTPIQSTSLLSIRPTMGTTPYDQSSDKQTGASTPWTTQPTTVEPPGNDSNAPLGSSPSSNGQNNTIKCEKAGYYPVPGNCRKFYRCADWDGNQGKRFSLYFYECAEGTIWDPTLETCNFEESVQPPRDCRGSAEKGNQSQSTTTEVTDSTVAELTDKTTPMVTKMETTTESTQLMTDDTTTLLSTSPVTTEPTSELESTQSQTMLTDNPTDSTDMASENTTPNESTTEDVTTNEGPNNLSQSMNQSQSECPELKEGQVTIVCPTGFRRHPKDCNLFYQCTISEDGEFSVVTLSCKNNTVYDERKIQCLPPDETEPCATKQSYRTRYARRIDREPISAVPIAPSESLCPKEGHFPYQGDCRRFFKCNKDKDGKMQGYFYQCPDDYSFSESTSRCEKSSSLPKCSRSLWYLSPPSLKWMTSKVPIEYLNREVR